MARHIAVFEPARSAGTQSTYSVTASSTEAIAANSTRRYLLLQNNSDTDIYISITGGTVTTANGFKLASGGGSLDLTTYQITGAITAIHGGTGTKTLTYFEG